MSAELDDVAPFHIAWITADEELGDTVQIVVYDPIEYRVPVFEADTELPLKADPGTVAARATELLQIDGGFIVHTMEPHGSGFAAVIEARPRNCPDKSIGQRVGSPSRITLGGQEISA